jgi:hypothetical protein
MNCLVCLPFPWWRDAQEQSGREADTQSRLQMEQTFGEQEVLEQHPEVASMGEGRHCG